MYFFVLYIIYVSLYFSYYRTYITLLRLLRVFPRRIYTTGQVDVVVVFETQMHDRANVITEVNGVTKRETLM